MTLAKRTGLTVQLGSLARGAALPREGAQRAFSGRAAASGGDQDDLTPIRNSDEAQGVAEREWILT